MRQAGPPDRANPSSLFSNFEENSGLTFLRYIGIIQSHRRRIGFVREGRDTPAEHNGSTKAAEVVSVSTAGNRLQPIGHTAQDSQG